MFGCGESCSAEREVERMENLIMLVEDLAAEAAKSLADGDASRAAEILQTLANEHECDRRVREDKRLLGLWIDWGRGPLPRQPFLEWAHTRRHKESRR